MIATSACGCASAHIHHAVAILQRQGGKTLTAHSVLRGSTALDQAVLGKEQQIRRAFKRLGCDIQNAHALFIGLDTLQDARERHAALLGTQRFVDGRYGQRVALPAIGKEQQGMIGLRAQQIARHIAFLRGQIQLVKDARSHAAQLPAAGIEHHCVLGHRRFQIVLLLNGGKFLLAQNGRAALVAVRPRQSRPAPF